MSARGCEVREVPCVLGMATSVREVPRRCVYVCAAVFVAHRCAVCARVTRKKFDLTVGHSSSFDPLTVECCGER